MRSFLYAFLLTLVFFHASATALEVADAENWVDPLHLKEHPALYAGQTVQFPASLLGSPGKWDADPNQTGWLSVSIRGVHGDFASSVYPNHVIPVVPEDSAIAADLDTYVRDRSIRDHHALFTATVRAQSMLRGGVQTIPYYCLEVESFEPLALTDWSRLSRDWGNKLGQRFFMILRPDQPQKRFLEKIPGFVVQPFEFSRGSKTTGYLGGSRPFATAIERDGAVRAQFDETFMHPRFGLAMAEIQIVGIQEGGTPWEVGLLVIKEWQPLRIWQTPLAPQSDGLQETEAPVSTQTAAPTMGSARPQPWHHELMDKLMPQDHVVNDFFKDAEEALKQSAYDDSGAKEAAQEYRYAVDDLWVTGDTPPTTVNPESLGSVWQRGTRTYTKRNMQTIHGGNVITTIDYGSSRQKVDTWWRLAKDPASGAFVRPDISATLERLAVIREEIETLLPERNKYVKAIQDVEENDRLETLKQLAENSRRTLKSWIESGSYDNPAGKKRLEDWAKRAEEQEQEYEELKAMYESAKPILAKLDTKYKRLLQEVAEYIAGLRPYVGYE